MAINEVLAVVEAMPAALRAELATLSGAPAPATLDRDASGGTGKAAFVTAVSNSS